MQLKESEIIEFVRTRLAEISAESSEMFLDEIDDRNLDTMIRNVVEESIVYVHQKCAPNMLEGETVNYNNEHMTGIEVRPLENGSVDIDMNGIRVLRLVSFKMADSPVLLTGYVDEDSPEGRRQLNEYACGTYDDPVLVLMADSSEYHPHYVYYSLKGIGLSPNIQFSLTYYPVPMRKEDADGGYSWRISAKLKEAVLNHVVGMTLRVYKEEERSQVFFARSAEYLQ